jgi:hypothetical protein
MYRGKFRGHLAYFAFELSMAFHRFLGKSRNRIIGFGEAEPVMRFGKGHVYGSA